MKGIQAIIFDLDGTLVDSNDQHAKAFEEAFHVNGFSIPYSKIRPLIGMGSDKLIPAALDHRPPKTLVKKIEEAKGAIFREKYFSTVRVFPGVAELLEKVRQKGRRLAVASSGAREDVRLLLSLFDGESCFDRIVTAEDAAKSKPDPDLLRTAARLLDVPASEIALVGDTPYDLAAGDHAGIETIAFRCGGWDDFSFHRADEIYDGPWDLLDRLPGSLLATGGLTEVA